MLGSRFSGENDTVRGLMLPQTVHLTCTYTIFQLRNSKASGHLVSRVMDGCVVAQCMSGCVGRGSTVCSLKLYGSASCKSH
jgi:hypothetical protein